MRDWGYLDFERLYPLHQARAFFVTRPKSNLDARRLYAAPVARTTGILCDQTIAFNDYQRHGHYPAHLRRIRSKGADTGQTLVVLINHARLTVLAICALYKIRWQVERFFKWIKQHLRIKRSFGTSENAVKLQVWIAVSVYVLVAIIRKRLNLQVSLYTVLQILSVTLFEKMPIQQAFPDSDDPTAIYMNSNQLDLFTS